MGRPSFVIEQKVPLNFFYCAPQVLLKIKVSIEPCLESVVEATLVRVSMRPGRKKNTVYSLQKKNRLHLCCNRDKNVLWLVENIKADEEPGTFAFISHCASSHWNTFKHCLFLCQFYISCVFFSSHSRHLSLRPLAARGPEALAPLA